MHVSVCKSLSPLGYRRDVNERKYKAVHNTAFMTEMIPHGRCASHIYNCLFCYYISQTLIFKAHAGEMRMDQIQSLFGPQTPVWSNRGTPQNYNEATVIIFVVQEYLAVFYLTSSLLLGQKHLKRDELRLKSQLGCAERGTCSPLYRYCKEQATRGWIDNYEIGFL